MKNALFIVYYFPPMGGSGVQRPLKFIKYLREFGWNPIVLCPYPGAYHTFDESLQKELESLNVEVHRVEGKTPFHIGNNRSSSPAKIQIPDWIAKVIRRFLRLFMFPDNKKGWIEPAINMGTELLQQKEFDLIFSTAPPFSNHMIGKELSSISGLPLVLDYRDEWYNNHFMDGDFQWQKNKSRSLEAECLKQASSITGLDHFMLEHMEVEYGNIINRAEVIPHGFDPDDFEKADQSTLKAREDKLDFLYSGLFYESNQPDLFLQALKQANEQGLLSIEDIQLHFQGGLDDRIKGEIKRLELEEFVTNYGYLSHDIAVSNLKKADVLWMISNFDESHKQVKTGKLFEYFGSAKPILGIMHPGKEADLLREYGTGFVADINDVQHVAEILGDIYHEWSRKNLPEAKQKFITQFNRKEITGYLAKIFDKISS